MDEKRCTSCGCSVANDASSTHFLCPSCGKVELVRCSHCRRTAVKYVCSGCEFEGP